MSPGNQISMIMWTWPICPKYLISQHINWQSLKLRETVHFIMFSYNLPWNLSPFKFQGDLWEAGNDNLNWWFSSRVLSHPEMLRNLMKGGSGRWTDKGWLRLSLPVLSSVLTACPPARSSLIHELVLVMGALLDSQKLWGCLQSKKAKNNWYIL